MSTTGSYRYSTYNIKYSQYPRYRMGYFARFQAYIQQGILDRVLYVNSTALAIDAFLG